MEAASTGPSRKARTALLGWDGAPRRYAPDRALSPGVGYGGGAFNLDEGAVLYVARGRVWKRPARAGAQAPPYD